MIMGYCWLDITGTEEHCGGMDFKIADTKNGVIAFQLDVKRPLPISLLVDALYLTRAGRRVILEEVQGQRALQQGFCGFRPRPGLKVSAPRVEVLRFDPSASVIWSALVGS
jgi:polyribonucleotide nucleotidyltransferase